MSQMTEHVVLLYPCVAEEAPPKSRGNHPGRIVPAALSYQSPVKELRRGPTSPPHCIEGLPLLRGRRWCKKCGPNQANIAT